MDEFISRMMKGDKSPSPKGERSVKGYAVNASDVPQIDEAIHVLLFAAMNGVPDGTHMVRSVGDKCSIFIGGVEAIAINRKGEASDLTEIGDYTITIERVA